MENKNNNQPNNIKEKPSIIGPILILIGFFVIVGAILGFINMWTGWDLVLKISGSRVEPLDDYVSNIALIVIGLLFIGLGMLISNKKLRALSRKHKWLPIVIILAILGFGYVIFYFASIEVQGGKDLWAASENKVEVLKELYENDNVKSSPEKLLIRAVQSNSKDVVDYLIEKGVNVDARRESDNLPILLGAIYWCDMNMIKTLLDAGADISLKNEFGNDALICAVMTTNDKINITELVEELMKRGADPTVKNNNGKNALEIAEPLMKNDVVETIKKYSK